MPTILYIETSTDVCSVAVSKDSQIIFKREELGGPSHASILGVFVNEALQELRESHIVLDAVAVSCGPGSYTGLRIGVIEAKGLCYGLNIPLIAIETLKIMAQHVRKSQIITEDTLLCPMIDARRMEVYDTIFDINLNIVREVSADIIDESSFIDFLDKQKVLFFGNGASKCKTTLNSSNAIFLDGVNPHALDMVEFAENAYANEQFVDIAYFEPFYLKEFVTTISKKKIL